MSNPPTFTNSTHDTHEFPECIGEVIWYTFQEKVTPQETTDNYHTRKISANKY